MNLERDRHADTIIRNHALFSTASGAIPVAIADIAAVSAVQLDMIRQLCQVYDVDFQLTRGKALVTSITSAALARVSAASLVKLIPVAGTVVGSISGAAMAGASSYALGQAFKAHLSSGGTFLDLDVERLKRIYREQFEKGKEQVRHWRAESGTSAPEDSAEKGNTGRSFFDFDRLRRTIQPNSQEASSPAASNRDAARPQTTVSVGGDAKESVETIRPTSSGITGPCTIAERLRTLTHLRDEGLVSASEYEEARRQILQGL